MKTVHGAEFYANKRHKGTPSNHNSSDDGLGGVSNASGFDSSPRSEDHQIGGKNTSGMRKVTKPYFFPIQNTRCLLKYFIFIIVTVSSPSIKSESDANSPDQPINSPMSGVGSAKQHNLNGLNDDYEYVPSSMVMTAGGPIIGESVSAIDDPAWPYEDEDLEVNFDQ